MYKQIEIPCIHGQKISDVLDIITSIPSIISLTIFIGITTLSLNYLRIKKRNHQVNCTSYAQNGSCKIIFAVYIMLVAKITVFPDYIFNEADPYVYLQDTFVILIGFGLSTINLVPFKSILDVFNYGLLFGIYQNIGNIFLFIPFGFLYKMAFEKNDTKKIIINAVLVSGGIELVQFFEPRSVDIDDIILNTLGAIVGILLFKKGKNFYEAKTAVDGKTEGNRR